MWGKTVVWLNKLENIVSAIQKPLQDDISEMMRRVQQKNPNIKLTDVFSR